MGTLLKSDVYWLLGMQFHDAQTDPTAIRFESLCYRDVIRWSVDGIDIMILGVS